MVQVVLIHIFCSLYQEKKMSSCCMFYVPKEGVVKPVWILSVSGHLALAVVEQVSVYDQGSWFPCIFSGTD